MAILLTRREVKQLEGFPNEPCHKCGKRYWSNTEEKYSWSCVYCGNLIYFRYGSFRQQIDLVMEASARNSEFVKTPCGTKIVPKTSETIRKIRFEEKTKKKA